MALRGSIAGPVSPGMTGGGLLVLGGAITRPQFSGTGPASRGTGTGQFPCSLFRTCVAADQPPRHERHRPFAAGTPARPGPQLPRRGALAGCGVRILAPSNRALAGPGDRHELTAILGRNRSPRPDATT